MLERVHLEIIKYLKEFGSLTKAAEKLCLTQPALTHSIRRLENILNIKVWNKCGRELKLTQAGEYIYKLSNDLLPQFNKAELDLEALSQGKMGKLRIGVECHPCYEWLVKIISGYLEDWKNVDIDVTRNFQFDGVKALLNRKVDLVITPDKNSHNQLEYIPVIEFELQLVVGSDHKFSNNDYIEPEDLMSETIYTYPVPKERLDVFSSFLIPGEVTPGEHIEIEATEIMLQLVSSNRGVTTFPDWLIRKYSDSYKIHGVRLGQNSITKKLYMVVRKEDLNIKYIRDFINRGIEGAMS